MSLNIKKKIDSAVKYVTGNTFRHQAGVFLIFVGISAVLWIVTTLNEEVQRHIDCTVRITNVPDSVTFISNPPGVVEVRVRGRGTHMLRNLFGSKPVLDIDFRKYGHDDRFSLSNRDLVQIVQNSIGDERLVQDLSPDSISVPYTTSPPLRLPVKVAVTATTRPNVTLFGHIRANIDSVNVYALGHVASKITYISTAEMHLNDLAASTTFPVRLMVPPGCRVVPETVDVTVNVEPMVTETRMLPIEPVNVPGHVRVLLAPEQVSVSYRMPRSQRNQLPDVRVIADFEGVDLESGVDKIAINTDEWLPNVFVETDSVNFYFNDAADNHTSQAVSQ